MKQTTCRDLRGACDAIITGATPEQMGANCKEHVMNMMQQGDSTHLEAIESMKQLSPEEQQAWYKGFLERFSSLPDVEDSISDAH